MSVGPERRCTREESRPAGRQRQPTLAHELVVIKRYENAEAYATTSDYGSPDGQVVTFIDLHVRALESGSPLVSDFEPLEI